MSTRNLAGTTAVVTGASRGFGRAIAIELAAAGVNVVGVARDKGQLESLQEQLGDTFRPWVGDVTDPVVAGRVIDQVRPDTVVLNAGASPLARQLSSQTWETFNTNWDVDVQHAFHFSREALLLPLEPGSLVIAVSSGAAIGGSPLSGGYAPSKAAMGFISSYAAWESERNGLGIIFKTVLPSLTAETEVGRNAARGYAGLQSLDLEAYLASIGPSITPEQVGKGVVEVSLDPGEHPSYRLTPDGPKPLG